MDGYYGEPVADVPIAIWWRLYRGERPVGYHQVIGGTKLYSKDGYCWKGGEIPHDGMAPQTALRDRANQRIFHLDTILFKKPGTKVEERAIALEDDTHGTVLWFVDTGVVARLEDISRGQYLRARRRVGSVHSLPEWAAEAERALAHVESETRVSPGAVLSIAASGILGGGIALWTSWSLTGEVGSIATFAGVFVAQFLHFRYRVRRLFTRRWMLQVALLASISTCLAVFATWSVLRLSGDVAWSPALALGAGAGMAVVTILAGDVVAWVRGGYRGEYKPVAARDIFDKTES